MKEATGELNMTVVTVVAIAALIAFFYLVIWPTIKINMALTTACTSAGNSGITTGEPTGDGGVICTLVGTGSAAQVTCEYQEYGEAKGSKVCD